MSDQLISLFIKYKFHILVGILLFFIADFIYRGPLESRLYLAEESRLPGWFVLPEDVSRDDVGVEIIYRAPALEWADDVEFIFRGKNNRTLMDVYGKSRMHPKTKDYGEFPNYTVVTVRGVTEIIEQKRADNILNISDDPELLKEITEIRQ